jgi:amino acid transporter
MQQNSKGSLVQAMSRWDLAGIAINGIIGAGIFALPSTAAGLLGFASPLAFVLCAVIISTLVLCFAEAAGHFAETGGPYLYAHKVFGPFAAFEVGWTTWLARVSAFAANTNVLVSYLAFFFPGFASGTGRTVFLIAAPALLAAVNIRGVAAGAQFGNVFAVIKVTALVLFAVAGLAFVDWNAFSAVTVSRDAPWGSALLVLIYAFVGFENAVIPAAEAKNPRKDSAWALLLALGVCTGIYLAIQVVALGTVPALSNSDRPLADSAQSFLGPAAGGFMSLLACISVMGNLNGSILAAPRISYALAEHRNFPALFARVHPHFGTPAAAIMVYAAIGAVLAVSGTFVWLATVSVAARLIGYIATCLAVPMLRRTSTPSTHFRIPWGPVVPAAGVLLSVWLLAQVDPRDLRDFGLAALAGAVLYFGMQRKPKL